MSSTMCVQRMTFWLPMIKLMVDATTGHEAVSFIDGMSDYNQISMDPKDEGINNLLYSKRHLLI